MTGVCEMCALSRRLKPRNGVLLCSECMSEIRRIFDDAPGPAAIRRAARLAALQKRAEAS
jgi:hypothetical protein